MKISCTAIILLDIFFSISIVFAEEPKAYLDKRAIIEGWENNYYFKLKTVEIDYSEHLIKDNFEKIDKTKISTDMNPERIVRDKYVTGIVDYTSKRFKWNIAIAKNGFENKDSIRSNAFDGKNSSSYSFSDNLGEIRIGLLGRSVEETDNIKPYLLLDSIVMPGYENKYALGVPKLSRRFNNPNTTVGQNIEYISGEPCHVLNYEAVVSGDKFQYTVWVAHNKDMMPMKYRDVFNGQLREEIVVEAADHVKTEVGDIWFPKTAYRTRNDINLGELTYKFNTASFKANVEVSENTFRVDFPAGAQIIDMVQNLMYEKIGADVDSVPEVYKIEGNDSESSTKTKLSNSQQDVTVYQPKSISVKKDTQEPEGHPLSSVHRFKSIAMIVGSVVLATICILGLFFRKKTRKE